MWVSDMYLTVFTLSKYRLFFIWSSQNLKVLRLYMNVYTRLVLPYTKLFNILLSNFLLCGDQFIIWGQDQFYTLQIWGGPVKKQPVYTEISNFMSSRRFVMALQYVRCVSKSVCYSTICYEQMPNSNKECSNQINHKMKIVPNWSNKITYTMSGQMVYACICIIICIQNQRRSFLLILLKN